MFFLVNLKKGKTTINKSILQCEVNYPRFKSQPLNTLKPIAPITEKKVTFILLKIYLILKLFIEFSPRRVPSEPKNPRYHKNTQYITTKTTPHPTLTCSQIPQTSVEL